MRRTSIYLHYCLFFLATLFFSNTQAQQVFKTTKTSTIGYLEYLPKDYHSNSHKYPIVIFLHGMGEKGPTGTNAGKLADGVSKLTKHGPPKHVKKGTQFPFILISPQLKSNYGDWSSNYVMEVINHVKTYLRIDERRIYLTGLSLGGGATWVTAQDYPNVFAAIAPICGSRNSRSKACAIAESKMAVWAFHGDRDNTVPLGRTREMVNAINACRPAEKAKLTIYPGVKHNSWDNAYQPNHSVHSPNVYDWLLSHVKNGGGSGSTNRGPSVNAGADQTITLPTNSVVLNGSASDEDGKIASYTWAKVSGGKATLIGASTRKLTAKNLVEGTYVFRLTVKDNDGSAKSDDVSVTVNDAKNSNKAPVASAGPDKTLTLPSSAVTVTGSGKDADGKIASYQWTKVSGGSAALSGAASKTLKLSGLKEGSYVFRLTVKDDKGATDADDVAVTVKEASSKKYRVPTANAGRDITVTLPNSVTIAGEGTAFGGYKIVSYKWTQIGGGSVRLSGATSSSLTLSNANGAGKRSFRLTVRDSRGYVGIDHVSVYFKEGSSKSSSSARVASTENVEVASLENTSLDGIADEGEVSSVIAESDLTNKNYDLSNFDVNELKDHTVTVFNDRGQKIYAGEWEGDSYHLIFNQRGLYYYNVSKDNRRVDSGKIVVKE